MGERVGRRIIRQSVSRKKHYDRTEPESRSSASPNGCASERRRQPHQHLPFAMAREPLPSQEAVRDIVTLACVGVPRDSLATAMSPARTCFYFTGLWMEKLYHLLVEQIHAGISMSTCTDSMPQYDAIQRLAAEKALSFIETLPELRRVLNTDVEATYHGDPAADSVQEVIYCYPGIKAIANYRIAHELVKLGVPIIPRMISERAHSETGIDIHPAATIGESFTIDHGTGVVIGATAILGHHVKIYQG